MVSLGPFRRPGTHGLIVAAIVLSLFILLSQLGYLYRSSSNGLPGWLKFGTSKHEMRAWQRDLAYAASETGQFSQERLGQTVLSVLEKQPADSQDDLIKQLTKALKELNVELKRPFVEMAMNTSISGVADFTAVHQLCVSKSWRTDVVFMCEGTDGGAEDVRTQLLTCLRFAIESGAGIIVPKAISNETEYQYLFDQSGSLSILGEACPELPIHASVETLNATSSHGITVVNPQLWLSLFTHDTATSIILADPQNWKGQFDDWLANSNITASHRIAVVPIEALAGRFPICHDTNAFVSSFGQILQFQPDIQRLAASVLQHLSTRYFLNLDPSVGIHRGAFLGAHLPKRQVDTEVSGMNYLEQLDRYLHMGREQNLTIIYAAASSDEAVRSFADIADGFIITTKHDLLSPDEKEELASLSQEQQELVDLLVLQKASYFGGTVHSPVDWNIALSRRAAAGTKLCPEENWLAVDGVEGIIKEHQPGALLSGPGKALLVDSLSEIMGRPESVVWAQSMWP